MRLTVNGRPHEVEAPLTLQEFLESLGVNLQFVAVAYNGEVVEREEFPRVGLKAGDTLEVVRPVGGG